MMNIKELLENYNKETISNVDSDNLKKIINYLNENKCTYINSLLEEYFDLFTIDYEVFVNKYLELNKKYNNNFFAEAQNNMNLYEEFFK